MTGLLRSARSTISESASVAPLRNLSGISGAGAAGCFFGGRPPDGGCQGAPGAGETEAETSRAGPREAQPVANETEARAVFDTITYSKGQAVVRMTETYLGEDVFRDAMRRYMKEHAYSNATSADLWHALDVVSGKAVGAVASRLIVTEFDAVFPALSVAEQVTT